jgi:hypothetical protein
VTSSQTTAKVGKQRNNTTGHKGLTLRPHLSRNATVKNRRGDKSAHYIIGAQQGCEFPRKQSTVASDGYAICNSMLAHVLKNWSECSREARLLAAKWLAVDLEEEAQGPKLLKTA